MRILSLNQPLQYDGLHIDCRSLLEIDAETAQTYDYILIHGGDGSIRRAVTHLQSLPQIPALILNPTGSFNVMAKLHKTPPLMSVLERLSKGESIGTTEVPYYRMNEMCFLFSAGNMGDAQHIFLAETFRFGVLKKGAAKYFLALLFLLPVHIVMTPFMLLSARRFFIFTPLSFIARFGTFYGKVPKRLEIDLDNKYNIVELDGDLVTVADSRLHISAGGTVRFVTAI